MKTCIHNHEMTPENTGTAIHFNKWGKEYLQHYCKQCRRDSTARYAATHKRPSRARKKSQAKAEARKKPPIAARLSCGKCKAVMRSPEARAEHRRRFHEVLWL